MLQIDWASHNNVIENVLVINPYDSTIQNMTSIDS